jgi:uncharacterized protein
VAVIDSNQKEMSIEIKSISQTDVVGILAINNREVPNVNELDGHDLQKIIGMSYTSKVVLQDSHPAGFLIALDAHSAYESENYKWFQQRYKNFIYIDRIVVHQAFHGKGIGKSLYFDLIDRCKQDRYASMCCEVNLRPCNERSLKFHHSVGFFEIDRFDNPASGKLVSMMQMKL